MNSSMPGKNISGIEITNISMHGIWLLADENEFFLSYDDFPWFREQPVSVIFNVREVSPGHYYWPDLDVDISREIIEHPDRFPLLAGTAEQ